MRQRASKAVLIIDYYFPPLAGAGVHRTLGYVRHLEEFGWSAVILTAEPGAHYFYDTSLLRWIPAGLPVRRTASIEPDRIVRRVLQKAPGDRNTPNGHGGPLPRTFLPHLTRLRSWFMSWFMFPDRRIGWLPFAVWAAGSLRRRFPIEVLYSTSTAVTSHLVAYTLKTLWGTRWVADFQDPWTEEYASEFPTRLHRGAARAIERLIVHHADRVTVTTEPMREAYRRRYPASSPDKFQVIPMGYDPQALGGLKRVPQQKFTVTHFGNFYATRSPGPFLQALGACLKREPTLRDSAEVRFFGSFEPRLRSLAETLIKEHCLEGVLRLLDPVPYRDGMQHLVNSDVLLLVSDSGGGGQCLVPSKLFEYFGVGRPTLALAPPGAIADFMREARAGLVVPPNDVNAIQDAILAFYRGWREGILTHRPNDEFIARCTWQARTAQFAAALDAALRRSGAFHPLTRPERTS